MGDEHTLLLAYLLENRSSDWDGSTIRVVGPSSEDEPIALVEFKRYDAYMFGPPNDEAFDGHPLYGRGLHPYGAFVIKGSSWIRQLARMNSVHPYHKAERYAKLRHYIFAFHDSTFECVAEGFEIAIHKGSMKEILPEMTKLLRWQGAV
jgi:hypothetical protein